uniref:Uncharacterized protein n=1 Tax=Rhizophora mucronata TaxID=61149 RepID=A0A2P2PRM3_RHIMU
MAYTQNVNSIIGSMFYSYFLVVCQLTSQNPRSASLDFRFFLCFWFLFLYTFDPSVEDLPFLIVCFGSQLSLIQCNSFASTSLQ